MFSQLLSVSTHLRTAFCSGNRPGDVLAMTTASESFLRSSLRVVKPMATFNRCCIRYHDCQPPFSGRVRSVSWWFQRVEQMPDEPDQLQAYVKRTVNPLVQGSFLHTFILPVLFPNVPQKDIVLVHHASLNTMHCPCSARQHQASS